MSQSERVCKNCKFSYCGKRCGVCKKAYDQKRRKGTTYGSWRCAKRRCEDSNHAMFYLYGGRGIKFCIDSVSSLEVAIGPRPEGYTLDRIDPNGNYEIGNVRWATAKEQCKNKRTHE